MDLESLRSELAGVIRQLEDAAMMEAVSNMYVLIGRLGRVQQLIDTIENRQEWSNEDE